MMLKQASAYKHHRRRPRIVRICDVRQHNRSLPLSSLSSLLVVFAGFFFCTKTSLLAHALSTTSTTKPKVGPSSCPKYSPVTQLENRFYTWKAGQKIRYQTTAADASDDNNKAKKKKAIVLIHGLFVNSDHWRRTLTFVNNELSDSYDAYALDLFGCGYSDKPPAASEIAQRCNGENGRFVRTNDMDDPTLYSPSILPDIRLGTPNGGERIANVDLRHPLNSPYNFYTWASLIVDFCRDVVNSDREITLVCNSIGTISALQAVMDSPDLFDGAFVVCPNFRELHSAEVPFATLTMPVLRTVQRLLREKGQGTFDFLAKPSIVKNILSEPYAVTSAIDDDLVQVLLDPLLTEGASQVVFDTLSYSAGPLPEQQLQMFPKDKPVWVCYGDQDPWTPGKRVEALSNLEPVERVIVLPGVGHCPHDEAPEQVHPLLVDFLKRLDDR